MNLVKLARRTFLAAALGWALSAAGAPTADALAAELAAPLTIHIISGSKEYQSEPSLKAFQQYLEENYNVRCTASWGNDGASSLENLDALPQAELMLIFARRMKLPENQMQLIRQHWEQGKPIVGLRTAGHAFQRDDNELFDRQVLGGHYQGHYGGQPVKVTAVPGAEDHPVLAGVGPFTSRKLYKAGELPATTTVLQIGDIGTAKHPVTIVNQYKGGRVFFSSLGVPEDFEDENFRRMLVNTIFWTTHRDPEKMKKSP
jgi:type 1 glutamine amidotransferase